MSRHEGDWTQTTARVLSHLRKLSRIGEPNITAQDKAAIDRVWASVGVRIDAYDDSGQWRKVALVRREGVRQRLLDGFRDAFRASDQDRLRRSDVARTAFLPGGRASRAGQARREFKRAHLLDWGNRLLAAEAANDATAANLATEAPPPPPPPPSAAEAAAASVANESSDEDSTDTDTAISHTIASLPEDTRSTVVAIMEGAAAEGYELSDWDELLRYARNRYVEAAAEFGAVDSVLAPALPQDAVQPGPFDDDLSELYENVSRSRSGRDGASVISDFSLSSRLSGLSFVSQREALLRLHRDMIDNRVSVDTIPGLKKTRSKLQKAVRKIRKAGTRLVKKVQNSLPGKR